jgi:hypothetical protein
VVPFSYRAEDKADDETGDDICGKIHDNVEHVKPPLKALRGFGKAGNAKARRSNIAHVFAVRRSRLCHL